MGWSRWRKSAALEIHPWGSTIADWERPDTLVMDLDPGEDVAWTSVIAAAEEVRGRLKSAGLVAFVKTSGGKGLHVVAPVKPKAEWPAAKAFAKSIADAMAADNPELYVSTIPKARRHGKILIDYLRNQRGMTAVAAYSTRARPGAPVSMPLAWNELSPGIGPAYFTIQNTPTRLASLAADPWGDFRAAAAPIEGRGRASRPNDISATRAGYAPPSQRRFSAGSTAARQPLIHRPRWWLRWRRQRFRRRLIRLVLSSIYWFGDLPIGDCFDEGFRSGPMLVRSALRATLLEPEKIGDLANLLVSVVHRTSPFAAGQAGGGNYLSQPRSAFRFLVAAAFLAAADRSARGRAAEAAPPIRPPRCAAGWPVDLPRPEPPGALPPASSLLTVAQARRSASFSETPRLS